MKNTEDMTFNEFVDWTCGYIVFGIGSGRPLKTLVHTVIDQAIRNQVFGVEKQ